MKKYLLVPSSIFVALLMAATIVIGISGCGKQQTATGSGGTTEAVQPQQNLNVSNVSIVKYEAYGHISYQVFSKLDNSTSQMCRADIATITLYGAGDKVLGVENNPNGIGWVYPPGRWCISSAFSDIPEEPVRADVKIDNLVWKDIPLPTPTFTVTQADFIPDSYGGGKVVGQFKYEGPDLASTTIWGVLLDGNQTPVGVYYNTVEKVSAGVTPFQLSTGNTNKGVTSVQVYFVWAP